MSSTWVGEPVWYATPLFPLPRPSTSQIIPPVSLTWVGESMICYPLTSTPPTFNLSNNTACVFDLGWWACMICYALTPTPQPSTSQIIPPVSSTGWWVCMICYPSTPTPPTFHLPNNTACGWNPTKGIKTSSKGNVSNKTIVFWARNESYCKLRSHKGLFMPLIYAQSNVSVELIVKWYNKLIQMLLLSYIGIHVSCCGSWAKKPP